MMTPQTNAALGRREFDLGDTRVTSMPAVLTIESTSICNLRCVMCPQAAGEVVRPRHLPQEVLARLLGPMAVAREAQLHGIGEPLASPAFWHMLESGTFHPHCVLNVNTNLTLLNDHRLGLLLDTTAELRLNISVDAATERTFARIRGAVFDEVVGNISRLVAARGEGRRPVIYMNMTLMRENIEEAPAFVDLAHTLGADGVFLWQMNHFSDERMARYKIDRPDWHFDYAKQGLWNFPALSNRCLREARRRADKCGIPLFLEGFKDIFFDEPQPSDTSEATRHIDAAPVSDPVPPVPAPIETVRDCRAPWEWAVITTDGEVGPCCFATRKIGNLHDASFEEIWNGADAQALRRDLRAGVVNRVCREAPCKYVKNTEAAVRGGVLASERI